MSPSKPHNQVINHLQHQIRTCSPSTPLQRSQAHCYRSSSSSLTAKPSLHRHGTCVFHLKKNLKSTSQSFAPTFSLLLRKTQLIFTRGAWAGEGVSSDRKQLDGKQIRKLKRKPLQENKLKKKSQHGLKGDDHNLFKVWDKEKNVRHTKTHVYSSVAQS